MEEDTDFVGDVVDVEDIFEVLIGWLACCQRKDQLPKHFHSHVDDLAIDDEVVVVVVAVADSEVVVVVVEPVVVAVVVVVVAVEVAVKAAQDEDGHKELKNAAVAVEAHKVSHYKH